MLDDEKVAVLEKHESGNLGNLRKPKNTLIEPRSSDVAASTGNLNTAKNLSVEHSNVGF